MPGYARSEIIDENTIGTYHCINRCVRRSYLCGVDNLSGRSFDHRKRWMKKQLSKLAKIFAIDIGVYAIMDNHFHVMLTNRPDLAARWNDDEVIERWWRLYPRRLLEEIPQQIRKMWLLDKKFIEKIRRRLSSISWFMKCLSEPIARRANKEDQVTGRFWQGRFSSKKVLDQEAAIETSIYIDLNPIKSGKADTVETSRDASIADRVEKVAKNLPLEFILPIREIIWQFVSETPYLLLEEEDYIEVVRCRAREIVEKRRKAVALNVFVYKCPTAIGTVVSMKREAKKRGRKWLKGIGLARKLRF